MFTIDQNPIRLFFRSRLLLTTALISVASLNCLPSQAVAQVYLDNVNPGDGVIETESTGFFDTLRQSDAVWTDADGLNASALATDQTGILTAEDVDTPISLQIHNSGLTMGGLQVDSGHYSFSGGDLSAGLDTLTFYVAGNADPAQPDAQLNIDSDINAAGSTIRIENDLDGDGTAESVGQVNLSGDTTADLIDNGGFLRLLSGSRTTANVTNRSGAELGIGGRLTGNLTNDGLAQLSSTLDGSLTNQGRFQTSGNATITGAAINTDNPDGAPRSRINVLDGHALTIENGGAAGNALDNGGITTIAGRLNAATVRNRADSDIILDDGQLDGDVTNEGTVRGSGSITGTVINRGLVQTNGDTANPSQLYIETLTNNGTLTISGDDTLRSAGAVRSEGTVAAPATVNIDGTLNAGLFNGNNSTLNMQSGDATITNNLTNVGTANIRGTIGGVLTNQGAVLTNGNTIVQRLDNAATGTTTVRTGHEVTTTSTTQNLGQLNVNGTLRGNVSNQVSGTDPTVFGTIALNSGGVITGNVTNAGRLNAGGTIRGSVDNSGTLNVIDAAELGDLDNSGSVVVESGETLTTNGDISNTGSIDLAGALNINDGDSRLVNSGTGNLTLSGAAITGDVLNQGSIDVNSDSSINGSLNNQNDITLNSTGGANVTLSVSDVFTNSGTVDGTGTGALTIAAGEYVNAGGESNNVRIVGNIRNEAVMNYTEDRVLEGNLINTTTGDFFVSANVGLDGNDLLNQGDVVVRVDTDSVGNLNDIDLLTNEGDFRITGTTSVSANSVINQGSGVLTVNGTLNSGSVVQNSAQISIGGAGTLNGGLNNSGQTTLAGGTVNGTLTNASGGVLTGNGRIVGALNNTGMATLGGTVTGAVTNTGTLTSSGTLTVGSLINDEVLRVASGSTLTSGTAVRNNDRATIAGTLDAALNNYGSTTLSGGSVTGAMTNFSDAILAGTGTLASLDNRGTASFGGTVTGAVTNTGTLTSSGALSVGSLVNDEVLEVSAGSTLTSGTAVQNNDRATITGTLNTALNNAGTTTLDGGSVTGMLTNSAGATLNGRGRLSALNNIGTATIGGTVTGAVTNTGMLTSSGTLSVGSLVNDQLLHVASGSTLSSATAVQNNDRAMITGTLDAALNNAGTTMLAGGSVTGVLTNATNATLNGTGTLARLNNNGTATIGGTVTGLTNEGVLISAGTLNVGTLTNNEIVRVATGSAMNITGSLNNTDRLVVGGQLSGAVVNSGSTLLNGGTITGTLSNTGTVSGSGTVQGQLTNGGTVDVTGNMAIQRLINNELLQIAQGGTLQSSGGVENNDRITLAGTLTGALLNNATGEVALNGGTVRGNVQNLGEVTGNGIVAGTLRNRGNATIGGQITNLVNLTGGTLNVAGNLTTDTFSNAGTATIAANNQLTVLDVALNQEGATEITLDAADNLQGGTLTVDGTLNGVLRNAGTLLGSGVITGEVVNTASGDTDWSGRIGGNFTNAGQADLAGSVAGNVVNGDGGTLIARGNLAVGGLTTNEAGGIMRVASGATMRASGLVLNESGATLSLLGTLSGNVENRGSMVQTGVLNGVLTTSGRADLGGTINGGLIYRGGALVTREDLNIAGDFLLRSNYGIAAGDSVAATRTIVDSGVTLGLRGELDGALVNSGTVNVVGTQATVTGTLTNNSVVDLSSRGASDTYNDVLTVGGLAGSGEYRLDIDTANMTADRIVIDGGAATGAYTLELNFRDESYVPSLGNRLTLIDADDNFRDQNTFTVTHSDLPSLSERIVYSVDQFETGGDVVLVSQTNPAIGALFGNVALTQSLIGSVINRPTSPFVTALVYEDDEKPCGIGSWGRVIGGHAKATGSTNNGVSNVESEITADYYGMQVGTDLACFDDRFAGWDMAFGVLGGINRGDTNQPVYAIDPNNSQNLSGTLTSFTSTEFEQRYAGVYVTASKGALQADLQYRVERTDFTIENTPVGNNRGLGLDKTDFSSDAQTLSGSLSYGFPVGKGGWAVVPTIGFAWSKMSTDSLPFSDGYRVTFEDSTRKIGFVGATLAKTFVQQADNSVLYAFATGTWYKDFADPTISIFDHDTDDSFVAQELESENLGAYGEISVGANWIKVLGPKSRGRQLSAGARVDARFGDNLDSVGVSGQLRWQF